MFFTTFVSRKYRSTKTRSIVSTLLFFGLFTLVCVGTQYLSQSDTSASLLKNHSLPSNIDQNNVALHVDEDSMPPSGSVVSSGETITYQILVTNTGNAAFHDVTVTEDLNNLVNHASLDDTPTASDGSSPTVEENIITWKGSLEAGQDVTLNYSVKVRPGNHDSTLQTLVGASGIAEDGTVTQSAFVTLHHKTAPYTATSSNASLERTILFGSLGTVLTAIALTILMIHHSKERKHLYRPVRQSGQISVSP